MLLASLTSAVGCSAGRVVASCCCPTALFSVAVSWPRCCLWSLVKLVALLTLELLKPDQLIVADYWLPVTSLWYWLRVEGSWSNVAAAWCQREELAAWSTTCVILFWKNDLFNICGRTSWCEVTKKVARLKVIEIQFCLHVTRTHSQHFCCSRMTPMVLEYGDTVYWRSYSSAEQNKIATRSVEFLILTSCTRRSKTLV